mgnify:FL=1
MSKKTKTILAVVLIAAIVLIAVGYAAISNINLKISGTASGEGSDSNFKVAFSGTPSGTGNASGTITNDHSAEMTVSGLTTNGDSASVTFEITNNSTDINADVAVTAGSSEQSGDFTITTTGGGTSITPGSTTTVTVTVTLNRTLVESSSTNFNVSLVASPSTTM